MVSEPGIPPSGLGSEPSAVKSALLGDCTIGGAPGSSWVLALAVADLLMCVRSQSFLDPSLILPGVPARGRSRCSTCRPCSGS